MAAGLQSAGKESRIGGPVWQEQKPGNDFKCTTEDTMCKPRQVCWVADHPEIGIRYCDEVFENGVYKGKPHGWETTWDKGATWHFSSRGLEEFQDMWPNLVVDPIYTSAPDTAEDIERELFGETLDEPIPDDLYEMLVG
jgi:hypothetical protein